MYTYQDLLEQGDDEKKRMDFVRDVINLHKSSEIYKTAVIADEYDRKRNRTILEFQKLVYTVTGRPMIDQYSSNYRLGRAFFPRFIRQENQYLLGNGVSWEKGQVKDRLGEDFDTKLQDAGHAALSGGVSFGFFNLDHLEIFKVLEFAPLYDEENGSLRAGVRFWQIDISKPLRATLYEEDGYTDYIWNRRNDNNASEIKEGEILHEKRPYIIKITGTDIDEEKIYNGENYPMFPIVPLWGNKQHQSELVGLREQIDAYDLIKSGFCDNVEEASYVYWAINGAGGMDDRDLADFIKKMRTIHAAVVDANGATATASTIDAPSESRETLLSRLEKDINKDAMALDTENIASGAATATEIRAAYEPLSTKADDFEYCVVEFIKGILKVAGIDDKPSFTRSTIVNTSEEIQVVLSAAQYLPDDYVTEKILTVLGDGDKAEEIIKQMEADELDRGIEYERSSTSRNGQDSGEVGKEDNQGVQAGDRGDRG